jgi:hypothetical protein
VNVNLSLSRVSCSAYSSSPITLRHNRGPPSRPPDADAISWNSSRRRWIVSRLKFIRNRTSSGERFQFSVENA